MVSSNDVPDKLNYFSSERIHVIARELINLYNKARSLRFGIDLDITKNKSDKKIRNLERRFLILSKYLIDADIDPRSYMSFVMKKENTPKQPFVNVITSLKKVDQYREDDKVQVSPGSKVQIMVNKYEAGVDPGLILNSGNFSLLDKYIFSRKFHMTQWYENIEDLVKMEWQLMTEQIKSYFREKYSKELEEIDG